MGAATGAPLGSPARRRLDAVAIPALLLAAGWVATAAAALDPSREIHQYTFRSWSLADGFPQASANAIVQGTDDYLYVATFDGLVRFDGVRVTPIPGDGTCSNRLTALALDTAGRLWVGTERSGLCWLDESGRLTAHRAPNGEPIGRVATLRAASRGGLWVATVDGVVRISGERISRFGTEAGLRNSFVTSLDEAADGTLWVGTSNGLCLLTNGSCREPEWARELADRGIGAIRISPDGGAWIGAGHRIYRVDGEVATPLALEPTARIAALHEDRDGNLWAGLDPGGLVRVTPKPGRLSRPPALAADNVIAITEDHEGNLWVGFGGSGLVALGEGRAIGLRLPDEARSLPVVPVAPDGRGGVWAGLRCGGVARVSAPGIELFGHERGLENLCVWALLPARDGGLWIGTYGDGAFRMLPDGRIRKLGGPSTRERVVRAFALENDGSLLAATDQGLHRHHPERGGFELVAGTADEDIASIDVAPDGALWLGTRAGALWLGPEGARRLDRSSGLGSDQVRTIRRDADGVVWLGTYGGGLARLAGDQLTVYDSSVGLPENVVSWFVEDRLGRFWLTGNRGVTRVERLQLEALAAGRLERLETDLFDGRDGMPASETNGSGQPAGALLPDDTLWVPTVAGLAVFDTAHEAARPRPPRVHVEEIRVDGRELDPSREIVLAAGSRHLEIQYTALSFRAPDRIRFRYRLEGFDERWIEAGHRRAAFYPIIPAGRLRFHVIAGTEDGAWNEEGASFAFEMRPPVYARPWFLATAVAVLAALFWSALRLRGLVQIRRQRELEREVGARTAELEQLAVLTEQIHGAVTLEETLDHVYASLRGVIPYDRIGLALLTEDRLELRAVWSRTRADREGISIGYQAPLEGSSLMEVLKSGQPRVIADLEAHLSAHPDSESTRRILAEGIRSSLTCPLRALGQPVGFLFFSSFTPNTYRPEHVRFLTQLAGQLSLVVGKSRLYEDLLATKGQLEEANRRLEEANRHLEQLAAVDALTGIGNRRAFDLRLDEEWRRMMRARLPLSLLMIDLDHFKPYNDGFGHAAGDECLRRVAAVLVANLRRVADFAARVGGEELAVILPETDPPAARRMAERLRAAVEALGIPHDPVTGSERVTISVGAATVTPLEPHGLDLLLRAADQALYEAKRAGRNLSRHRTLTTEERDPRPPQG